MTHASVTFRTLARHDLPELEASFPEASPDAHKKRLAKQEKGAYLYSGAFVGRKIVAIQLVRWQGSNLPENRALSPYPEIGSLFVLPDYRRQGLATRLLAYSESKIRARGDKGASLTIQDDNAISIRLHLANGYEAIGPARPRRTQPDKPRTYYVKHFAKS